MKPQEGKDTKIQKAASNIAITEKKEKQDVIQIIYII